MQRPVRESTNSAQDFTAPITEEVKNGTDEPTNEQLPEMKQEIKMEPVVDGRSTAAASNRA